MRAIRAVLYFFVGVLLALDVSLAFAGNTYSGVTPPAYYGWRKTTSTGQYYNTAQEVATANAQTLGSCSTTTAGVCTAYYLNGGSGGIAQRYNLGYMCPNHVSQAYPNPTCSGTCPGTEQYNPTTQMCEAPATPCEMYPGTSSTPITQPSNCSCPAGTQWVGGAGCRKKCTGSNAGDVANAGWDINLPNGQTEGCWGGCGIQHTSGTYYIYKDGSRSAPATYTGWACAGNGAGTANTTDGQPQPNNPATETAAKHTPKCSALEGVITSSSGNVMCLPSSTTPAPSVPKIENKKITETYPDNSTKITETTTTKDPYTGATHVITTSTGSGGQAGTGTITTTSGTSSTSGAGGAPGTGEGGSGDCDPRKDFCGGPGTGGLYQKKTKTVASVVGDFKTGLMSSPVGSASTGFFTVSTPSGACPNWVVEVPFLNVTLNLSQYFCTATAISMMQLVGAVLMFVAAFVGFRWAIL